MATLPALTKTYSTIRNMPFPSTADALAGFRSANWLLKEAMIGNTQGGTQGGTRNPNSLWTVVSSSNGVTASNTDLWGSTYDPSKIVLANNGTPHSWILLKNTTLGYQFLIDCNNTSNQNLRYAACPISNPFSSGTPSSAPENTAYEIDARASNTSKATTVINVFAGYINQYISGAPALYMHYTTTEDGQFYAFISKAGSGVFYGALALLKTINAHPSDINNVFLISDDTTSNRGVWQNSGVINSYYTVCRYPSGAYMTNGGLGPNPVYAGYGYMADGAAQDRNVDTLTATYNVYQAEIQGMLPSPLYRGIIPDLYITGGGLIGSCIPSPAACERTIVGSMIVPFIGGPPIV